MPQHGDTNVQANNDNTDPKPTPPAASDPVQGKQPHAICNKLQNTCPPLYGWSGKRCGIAVATVAFLIMILCIVDVFTLQTGVGILILLICMCSIISLKANVSQSQCLVEHISTNLHSVRQNTAAAHENGFYTCCYTSNSG